MYIPKDLLPVEARENTLRKVEEVLSRFAKDGVPLLDPEEDMEVRKSNVCHIVRFRLLISF
jgi:ATP-dependent RNA helicase DOB1